MTTSPKVAIKIEEQETSSSPPETPRLLRPNYLSCSNVSNITDLSIALVSPGFSKHIMNDKFMRERIQQSICVQSKQQDIINQRISASVAKSPAHEAQGRTARRLPRRLSLDDTSRVVRGLQTAPIHGSARSSVTTPGHEHAEQERDRRSSYLQQPYKRRRSRTALQIEPHHQAGAAHAQIPSPPQVMLPPPPPPMTAGVHRLTPPQSAGLGYHALTLPSLRTTMQGRQPATPPTTALDEAGLDTLSKAARLKTMREEYLRACAAGFDALYGLLE